MCEHIATMQRYELKYILSPNQTEELLKRLDGYMREDAYGLTSIASLYFDTPDRALIRASIEKPEFKEKLRLRSYGQACENSTLFLELKRKADGIVYKRRIATNQRSVDEFLSGRDDVFEESQIAREIKFFRDHYKTLVPSCMIIYDRTAYFEPNGDLRMTIDRNPRYRTEDLLLTSGMDGVSLLPEGYTILEIKVQASLPLWLTKILSEIKSYNGGFSKYGEAYKRQILQNNNYMVV